MRKLIYLLVLLTLGIQASTAVAQIKAFPQAEGFGAVATGGRGGDVYHVTNLTDAGVGSLRYGIENAPAAGRTIVFDVGGWININSKLGVTKNKITIAAQTAPGGIGVRGAQFSVGGDDVIVRHMRFRPGKGAGTDNDSINTNDNAQRVIYDHISAEFSTDGGFDAQATDVTLQYSSVSWGLQTHSTGSLLENPHRLSMHHNVYAHNNTRNPKHRVQETLDWVNNIVYNWDTRAIELQGTSDPSYQWTANIDGNYFIAGANHDGVKPLSGGSTQNYETWWGTNAYDSDEDSAHDGVDYSYGDREFSAVTSALTRWRTTPFPVEEVWKDASTQAAYERVLAEFGATPWDRDEVNQLLHDDIANRTGTIISHENQLVARGVGNGGFGTLGGVPAPTDTDRDGIPDAWETKHGTDPNVANNNGDFDNDGYTDLEEYLNDTAAFKAIGALQFDGAGRYADWNHWTNRWEPSWADEVQINNGTATVDAVGQKAGVVKLGAQAGTGGTLSVTSGWLEVTEEMVIGSTQAGTVTQTGGAVRVLGSDGVHITAGTYNLSGGLLDTPRLSKDIEGAMSFTGGTLNADLVEFDLVNNGGTISAGNSPGILYIMGDLTLNSGSIKIELAGTEENQFDQVVVDGHLTAGGTVEVLLAGFTPTIGDTFDIFDFATASGSFSFSLPTLGEELEWDTSDLLSNGTLAVISSIAENADFDGDGDVDGRDFLIWQRGFGLTEQSDNTLGDANRDGTIDGEDLAVWQAQYGQETQQAETVQVPESGTLQLWSLALMVYAIRR